MNKKINEISERILSLIDKKNITIYELAKRTGMYEASLRNSLQLNAGFRGAVALKRVADALNVTTDYLITGEKSPEENKIDENKEIKKLREEVKELRDVIKEKEKTIQTIRKALSGNKI